MSAINGVGGDVDFFKLNAGAVGTANEGKFQLEYTGAGIVYTSSSPLVDIYTFVIRVTTSTGDISDIQIGGEIGAIGALKNLQPSFGTISNKVKTVNDRILIPASDWATASNGTALIGDSKKQQLVYSFTGSGIPDNWVMDPNNGELTQATPAVNTTNVPGVFAGNPLGIYTINLKIEDANAVGTPVGAASGYTSLFAQQTGLTVRMEPAAVNAGALSTSCVVDPPSVGAATITADGVMGPENFVQLVSCVYYIADTNLILNEDLIYDNSTIPNPDTGIDINVVSYRIGTESHKSGTISFSINTLSPYNAGNSDNDFNMPGTTFYYRAVGETEWRILPRSLESNRVGTTSPVIDVDALQSPLRDEPAPLDQPDAANANNSNYRIDDAGTNDVWVQSVRAFNYNDIIGTFGIVGVTGIEYAILVNRVRQYEPGSGTSKANGITRSWVVADDLEYPTCVPWQGKNCVVENGGAGNLFKYNRSIQSASALLFLDTTAGSIYARSPYGDYVNEFYTDATNFTPYIPATGSLPYVNILMDRVLTVSTLAQWTTLSDGNPGTPSSLINLQWVVGYDQQGTKLVYSDIADGVSAVQVSSNPTPPFSRDKGTLRISKN